MSIIQGFCSTCEMIDNKLVLKKYKSRFISLGLLANEVHWYKRFTDIPGIPPHTPKLLDYSGDTLVLEYVGNPITKDTMIVDFKNQLREIAYFLKYHHCRHCDITPGNLLVLNTKISLIDFGWAIEMDQNPYRRWKHVDKRLLDNMSSGYRAPNWPNDKYSLTKIYEKFSRDPNNKLVFY
ncbi:MAG: hypothetical protein ACM3YE_02905 [Bacteroidota bacterium]